MFDTLLAGVTSAQTSNTLAGPAILSGTYPSQGSSFINRPLITSGSGYNAARPANSVQSPTAGSQPGTAATAGTSASATSPRSNLMNSATAGPAAAATAAALATAQQRYRALQGLSAFPGTAQQGMGHPHHMGALPGQAAAYGRAPGPQSGALAPSQSASRQAARQAALPYASQGYGAQSHAHFSAPAQLAYSAQAQVSYALGQRAYSSRLQPTAQLQSQLQPQRQVSAPYGSQAQLPYSTSTGLQNQYQPQHQQQLPYTQHQGPYTSAAQPYAPAAPQPAPQPPPLTVQHLTFSKLASQPKNAIDLISEDAVLPTFPLKKKKPKKRKYAGLDAFAAEVYRHKELAQGARREVLQCQVVKKGPIGRPPKVRCVM